MASRRINRRKSGGDPLRLIRAVVIGCVLTAAMVLLFACTLRWQWIKTERIPFVNTLIKALAACVTGVLLADPSKERVWLSAGFAGLCTILLSFVVFSILNGSFAPRWSNLSDLLMAFACGACSAILTARTKESLSTKKD